MSVAVDDRVVEPGPDAPNRLRRLVVGHSAAPSLGALILPLGAGAESGRLSIDGHPVPSPPRTVLNQDMNYPLLVSHSAGERRQSGS